MVLSSFPPCKKGDETRDYEDMAQATLACDAILRGSNPFYSDLLHGINNNNMGFVQAPSASVITGEVVVNEKGKPEGVALSPGVIVVVCISAIAVLLIFLCMSEILNSLFWSRRQHNTSIFTRQDVHDDHSTAAPAAGRIEVAGSNPSDVAQSNGSLEVTSSTSGSNDSQVAGPKQGLAHWVIKGLPIIKYKKQQVLHSGLIISNNSASCVELIAGGNDHRNSGVMITVAERDHDIESALPDQKTTCNEAPSDYDRLECVVCLSLFEEDEDVRVLPRCCHSFHAACIDSWLLLHSTCPLCRVQISSLDVEGDAESAAASYVDIACNN